MKRINNLILALAGLFAVACADTFEERYDLAVNTDRYSVTAEAGKLPVTVYCSGAWTAQLTAESAWATLDRTAGSGITTIRLNYADNPGLTRSVGVVLRGSGLEKTVTVVQKAGITAPELIFLSKDLAFANGAYKGTAAFETNLPDELLRDVVPAVTYAAEGDAWISDVVYHADDAEAGETEIPLARRGLITFATAANATGEPRTATVGCSVTDADGNVFGDSFTVTQSADEARITLADDVAPIEGGRRAVAFSTNLGALLAEMKVEVTYADPAVADFISDVELGAGKSVTILVYLLDDDGMQRLVFEDDRTAVLRSRHTVHLFNPEPKILDLIRQFIPRRGNFFCDCVFTRLQIILPRRIIPLELQGTSLIANSVSLDSIGQAHKVEGSRADAIAILVNLVHDTSGRLRLSILDGGAAVDCRCGLLGGIVG